MRTIEAERLTASEQKQRDIECRFVSRAIRGAWSGTEEDSDSDAAAERTWFRLDYLYCHLQMSCF